MNLLDTIKGSLLESFFPAGWDLKKIDECCSNDPETITERQPFWNKDFTPVPCDNIYDFNVLMGHEIALEIKKARDEG
ncbi:MAG TPA: glucosamine-6-phosphate isomerase, partial [Clostridiaceae bacterium]|nr:glucosamine-6-phosphate isomerase [Clostridiaceae bacterium]